MLKKNIVALYMLLLLTTILSLSSGASAQGATGDEPVTVTFGLSEAEIAADSLVELRLSRALNPGEGRIAVFIGATDYSSLFSLENLSLSYKPSVFPLPLGENQLSVYLIDNQGEWKTLGDFQLQVVEDPNSVEPGTQIPDEPIEAAENYPEDGESSDGIEFTPNLSINIKSQNQVLSFPRDSAPERNPFTDVAGQGSISFKVTNRGWSFSNQFDLAGSSFRQEALRFGELQNKAPRIDLSSYIVELSKGRFKFNLGHVSFGSNRHLINGFSSRGFTVAVPIGKQNEFTLAAANGTSVVGYGNFLGLSRKKHSLISGTFAREFIKERPGGLRFEFSLMRGSLLPLENFNQGEINDAEKSIGFGFRVAGNTQNQRLRYEAGFTRSKFTNPSDPDLEQGFELTPVTSETKNARYGEISLDIVQGLKLWKEKKLKLTGTYRHEEITPLFRSVGVFTQADRRKHQFEFTGNLGEINFGFGNLRDRDNLDDIASILKTLNRRNNVNVGIPLNSFFTGEKSIKWLPTVSYTFDLTHQFGAFLPTAGLFNSESHVPNQKSYNQSFNAQWNVAENLSVGYAHTRAFQDNRQPGRENADLASASNAITVNYRPFESLGLDIDFARERQKSFEQQRIDRTFRLGTRGTWATPFLKNSIFSGGFSVTLAGDTGNLNDTRNGEMDAQWAYSFNLGEKRFKKVAGQFFIRFANRYGDSIDRQFFFNTINKSQTFNAGLTFNFF
ncbi:MAG: hypothetical protein HKN25_06315 [Pyrinomonadaceae bacterium]|nr:hypothetical protein [Pyrinomonadaceae bacterium]